MSNQTEFSDLKVMVIDDSKTIRRSAETLLKKAGCEVLTAENGFEALPIISTEHPDILFIDIMMPRLDGYQTCSLVKSNPNFSDIPIVMLSSKDGLFDRAKGRVVGAEEYLTKPFTREDLLGAIRTHLLSKTNIAPAAAAIAATDTPAEPEAKTPEPELNATTSVEPLELTIEEPEQTSDDVPNVEADTSVQDPEPVITDGEPLSLAIEEEPAPANNTDEQIEQEHNKPSSTSEPLSLVDDDPLSLDPK